MVGEGWKEVSEEGKAFLKELLQVDPKRRLTASQALSHHWLKQEGPSLNRRLSSITGLAAMASKNKKRISKGATHAVEEPQIIAQDNATPNPDDKAMQAEDKIEVTL